MICPLCGNKDESYFFNGHKGIYCRKCVSFKRVLLTEELEPLDYQIGDDVGDYHFDYPLTTFQEDISIKCLNYIKERDVLLHCVCGAGKTEIVVRTIDDYLKRGKKVCYAISRREVVIELSERFKKIFKNAKVIALYGGHHNELVGDLIVCTTHQLFRYYKTFDLLILDEVDAFPLNGNRELMNIAFNSCTGHVIFSTATVNDFLKSILKERTYTELKLYLRPSLKPLIVPKVLYGPSIFLHIYLFIILKRMDKQCIIFVSSKKECLLLYRLFKYLLSCTYVYAEAEDRNKNIKDFKDKKYKFIFATSVLERGITIKDINVIILNLHKDIFKEENLVQMLGRVGRNFLNPYGDAYILSSFRSKEIIKAIEFIKEANHVSKMSLL